MLRVCVVKQHTSYDLFTRTGPDLRAIVESSNWRSGPIGLWEAFDTTARVVCEDPSPECQIGKRHWSRYVEGWDLWPADAVADDADDVDWSAYDIVICFDVAVPSRVVARFPGVMWCYYFIEGGPTAIDEEFRGSPYFGYNVFLDHRLSKAVLTAESPAATQMAASRRAVLDFPYYMMSADSVSRLYPELVGSQRSGMCLSHHSRGVISPDELTGLERFGPVRTEWTTISDIHRAEIRSIYFVVHPDSIPRAGLALIEAISAGCLALAPSNQLWGFPELVVRELDFDTFDGLLAVLSRLESDPELSRRCLSEQRSRVQEWCYANPAHNLEVLHRAFLSSTATPQRQHRAEAWSHARAAMETAALRLAGLLRRERRQDGQQSGII
jgi:hypothetical protein